MIPASHLLIEPLETRIAPARVILVGAPNNEATDVDYSDTNAAEDALFIDTELAPSSDLIAKAVGGGALGTADTHYLRISSGDQIRFYANNGFTDPTVTMLKGNAVVFFVDFNNDNEITENEITGIALGANANILLKKGLPGDIIANLDEKGSSTLADDTLGFSEPGGVSSLVSIKQGIAGINAGASIGGSIIAAGNINNINIFGSAANILAGSAANGVAFDFYPGVDGGDGTIGWTADQGTNGPSITKVTIRGVTGGSEPGRIEAGAGGPGGKGGSLSNLILSEDTDGFVLKAGDGGAGTSKGGAGGSIQKVYIAGAVDLSVGDLVSIQAGLGGNATGTGGAGGALSDIYIGYAPAGSKVTPSTALLLDQVSLTAGTGGSAKSGGVGGALSRIDVNISTPNSEVSPDIIEVFAAAGQGGAGGVGSPGKSGTGGNVTTVTLRNEESRFSSAPDMVLQAGDGGLTDVGNLSTGGAGGSLKTVILRGANLTVHAGNGANGKTGGAGGAFTNVTVEDTEEIVAQNGDFAAGNGGNSASGNGAKGGNVVNLKIGLGDFTLFNLHAGDGGDATGSTGKGGLGGNITDTAVLDSDVGLFAVGDFMVEAGDGGDGPRGGGNGGAISKSSFDATTMNAFVLAGDGGSAVDATPAASPLGAGGKGGALTQTNISALGPIDVDLYATGNASAGKGGNGGGRGAGGVGGTVTTVNLTADGTADLHAGRGGDGASAAAGAGGDIKSALIVSFFSSSLLEAGSGGLNGTAPGRGGSVLGKSASLLSGVFSFSGLTIKAGDGTHGGAGGMLKYIGYGSSADEVIVDEVVITPTPQGNIVIQAGNGSAEGNFAGAGGNIDGVSGVFASDLTDLDLIPPDITYDTLIFAGDVIVTGSSTKSAAGGSISNVDLRGGGNVGGVLLIEAGDANTTTGSKGAKGGDVKAVAISELLVDNIFRGVAAGNGGNAATKGGPGGNLTDIKVLGHDVGVRLGLAYGYESMGGLFAGAGGTGSTPGLNGSVSTVTAQMIAAIVAGRGEAPQLAEKVTGVYVGTPTDLLRDTELDIDPNEDPTGNDPAYSAYTIDSYLTNTFVGATMDPTRIDGNKFTWVDSIVNGVYDPGEVPIDGLIAAKFFDQVKSNFTPEARLGTGGLFDFDNKY